MCRCTAGSDVFLVVWGQRREAVTHLVMHQPLQIPGLLCFQHFITDSLSISIPDFYSYICCSDDLPFWISFSFFLRVSGLDLPCFDLMYLKEKTFLNKSETYLGVHSCMVWLLMFFHSSYSCFCCRGLVSEACHLDSAAPGQNFPSNWQVLNFSPEGPLSCLVL